MSVLTNTFLYQLGIEGVQLTTDVIKAVLLDSGYTPDKDHDAYSDISADEVAGAGYTATGQAITTQAWTQVDASDWVWFNSDDVVWTTATLTDVTYVALVDVTATNLLIGVWDITGAPLAPVAGDLTITVDALGWFRSAQSA
jgi:hypothetical protein